MGMYRNEFTIAGYRHETWRQFQRASRYAAVVSEDDKKPAMGNRYFGDR
jgi:hypothetical protein